MHKPVSHTHSSFQSECVKHVVFDTLYKITGLANDVKKMKILDRIKKLGIGGFKIHSSIQPEYLKADFFSQKQRSKKHFELGSAMNNEKVLMKYINFHENPTAQSNDSKFVICAISITFRFAIRSTLH